MKLRLSILLLAAALAAAPAAGQTIKSLGYNTTNGNIVAATNVTFTNSVGFATNARAATRTNLGGTTVGNALFTAATTNAARVALGATVVGENIFTVPLQYQELFLRINADNTVSSLTPATTRTNLGLGATNAVTFSNITASGTLAVTGNVTLSGTDNLAPSQTTNSASSLMTRSLSDTRYGEWISQTEMGQLEFTTVGVATATLGGSAQPGFTNILSGSYLRLYGFTNTGDYNVVNVLAQSLMWLNSGLTAQLNDGVGLYVRATVGGGTNRVARIVYAGVSSNQVAGIVGTNGIDRRGFALEIANTTNSSTNNLRLIAQDGTNGSVASAWVPVSSGGGASSYFITHSNNATRAFYGADNARPSRTPVITLNHVLNAGTQASQPTGILFSIVNTNNDTVAGSVFIRAAWQMINANLVGY